MTPEKTYVVAWRTPNNAGTFEITTNYFPGIGATILDAAGYPPIECPFVVVSIELLNPEKYLTK